MEAQLSVLIVVKGVYERACSRCSSMDRGETHQKPLHDSWMYSNVEVNLNWAADFPVRFILLAALARLAISISLSLSCEFARTSELHDPHPKGRTLISGKGGGSCKP
jgi:hypothetical protein